MLRYKQNLQAQGSTSIAGEFIGDVDMAHFEVRDGLRKSRRAHGGDEVKLGPIKVHHV